METATLGGGCFWCLEAVFSNLEGVLEVLPGYCGGKTPEPTYAAVCSGETGHAEVVRLQFDPSVISYGEILEVFFAVHDPTTLDRQGNDVGTQYRSAIFFHSEGQRQIAESLVGELGKQFDSPIVTEIVPAETFYPAEDDHLNYFENHGNQPYCRFVVAPKLEKFRRKFSSRLKR